MSKQSIIGTKDHPDISSNLSFCAWNINGLSSKYLGNKLQSIDFLSVVDNSDFIVLTEIGNCSDLEIAGYKSLFNVPLLTSREKVVGTLEE